MGRYRIDRRRIREVIRRKNLHDTHAAQRILGRQWTLKPQDLVVALKLVTLFGRRFTYSELSESLVLSRYEVHAAAQRLVLAGLATDDHGLIQRHKEAIREFVLWGARYAFPPVYTGETIGVPTSYLALSRLGEVTIREVDLNTHRHVTVWPHEGVPRYPRPNPVRYPHDVTRGQGMLPLYPTLPLAVHMDYTIYPWVALVDALRSVHHRKHLEILREHVNRRLPREADAPWEGETPWA